ncbi:MAG: autotransporter assembly complex family protein [Mizugakiibacter sp.]|uniref:autotransporter assembly complex protein TamA n=1 Tax=Mizugakiibacter sp. TaxID=1972610 RepID=UPI0031CAAECD|nr:autotransporter assembly complex protein TamA [Xanthomonadaceae bacterium]
MRRPLRRLGSLLLALTLLAAPAAWAARVTVSVDGIDGALKDAVLASIEIRQYAARDVTEAQVRRLYQRAPEQARRALEPHGYYNAQVRGELRRDDAGWHATLHVVPGEPVEVTALEIALEAPAAKLREVGQAIRQFQPKVGQPLDQAAYEKSKSAIGAALTETGFLDARLTVHRIEVSRRDNRATIRLAWEPGRRYRFGATEFHGAQFRRGFLDRYLPWKAGDDFALSKLLALQRRLTDADYFAYVDVEPDVEHAVDGVVPIKVGVAPAKRTVYSAGIFVGTDTGPGVRAGIQRRWINDRGHKFGVDTLIAQRLKTAAVTYGIPYPGPNDRSFNFGANFRDENTATTRSRTFGLVANETRQWRGFTRTVGVHLLTGDFTIGSGPAAERGNTTLLYPQVSLSRKQGDDPLFVRHGWAFTVAARGASAGLLSQADFGQIVADAKWIRAFKGRNRLILRGSAGVTWTDAFDKLPPELRFFAGGDRSIRGYGYQTIGPKNDAGLVIGGKNLAVASAEVEHYFTRNWGMAAFVDAGDAFTSTADFRLKTGVGLGVRWRSPVGMVRVDLGTPVRDSQRHGVELHIVIGPDL